MALVRWEVGDEGVEMVLSAEGSSEWGAFRVAVAFQVVVKVDGFD